MKTETIKEALQMIKDKVPYETVQNATGISIEKICVSMFLCLVISVLSKQFLITKHLNSRVNAQLAILMVLLSTSTAFLTAAVMRSACH